MKYNVNPRNRDKLSVLGYGCMRFGGDNITTSFVGGFDKKKAEEVKRREKHLRMRTTVV